MGGHLSKVDHLVLAELHTAPVAGWPVRTRSRQERSSPTQRDPFVTNPSQAIDATAFSQRTRGTQDEQKFRTVRRVERRSIQSIYGYAKFYHFYIFIFVYYNKKINLKKSKNNKT